MCACGCFLIAAIAAGLIYTIMHGLWFAAIAIVVFSLIIGWFGRRAAISRNPPPKA